MYAFTFLRRLYRNTLPGVFKYCKYKMCARKQIRLDAVLRFRFAPVEVNNHWRRGSCPRDTMWRSQEFVKGEVGKKFSLKLRTQSTYTYRAYIYSLFACNYMIILCFINNIMYIPIVATILFSKGKQQSH